MSFKDLSIKFSYESGVDNLVKDFYIPVLSKSNKYDRIAGYFSSSSLAIAARGISGLIMNGGIMRIIASPRMSIKDIEVIESTTKTPEELIASNLILELNSIESKIERDHIAALGWLLANGLLEIKIALVPKKDSSNSYEEIDKNAIFHQKIGILHDLQGNVISFSGSLNETAFGWTRNIEEFKVFKSWEDGQKDYLKYDEKRFEDYWYNLKTNVSVINLPNAVKDKLLECSEDFSIDDFIAKDKSSAYYTVDRIDEDDLSLFSYQQEAVEEWKANDRSLMFEMATGTGKTRTAIACINEIIKNEQKSIIVISCPQGTLSLQWLEEIRKLKIKYDDFLIADGTNRKWKVELEESITKVSTGYNKSLIIYTTHRTGCSEYFINSINSITKDIVTCLVGDEAHGLGASESKKGLLNEYKCRIGLSATPKRWFDEEGTNELYKYFGEKSFEFTIADALNTINPLTGKPFLVNYYYHPCFISLDNSEIEEYERLSEKMSKMNFFTKYNDEYEKSIEFLTFARANILKGAINKYSRLEDILLSIDEVKNTIIFVTDSQIDKVMKILKKHMIIAHRFTQNEGTHPDKRYGGRSERQYLIDKFKEGAYQVLVAIKCLDEGIDIPSADTAIIMASSTNPREYIQRIGRVIRQEKDKERANIFDFIIKPDLTRINNSIIRDYEKSILEKEIVRLTDMSSNALNNSDALEQIYNVKRGD